MADGDLSSEEMETLTKLMGTTPLPDEKHNVHTFLFNVATAKDTTKLGFLEPEELGKPKLPVRSNKNMALIADKIMENDMFKEYFLAEGEITTATSLSKEGFLMKMAVTQKREIADVTKKRKISRGWFKKKEEESEGGGSYPYPMPPGGY